MNKFLFPYLNSVNLFYIRILLLSIYTVNYCWPAEVVLIVRASVTTMSFFLFFVLRLLELDLVVAEDVIHRKQGFEVVIPKFFDLFLVISMKTL
jgi:hypothetical protein